jgi:serine/threonine protein kinase
MTVLELCANGSVEDHLFIEVEPQPSWQQKLELCRGIAKGMAYLHSKGIMHRDLKPANCLLDDRANPKIADFGNAKNAGDSNASFRAEQTTNIGTPVYMAPELMADNKVMTEYDGAMVDVYSFGILMWAVMSRTKVIAPTAFDAVHSPHHMHIHHGTYTPHETAHEPTHLPFFSPCPAASSPLLAVRRSPVDEGL